MQYVPLEIISDFIVCTFQTGQGSTGEHVYNTWLKLQECYDRKHGIFFSSEKKQRWNLIPSQMSGQLGSWILNRNIIFSYSRPAAAAGIGMR